MSYIFHLALYNNKLSKGVIIMNYQQALEYIHSLNRFGSVLGLERISELLSLLGSPQKKLKFVHIAGTNGKGSTTAMTAYALTNAGYKTGMYISPFVLEFRERIQIDGEMISEQDLADCCEVAKAAAEQMKQQGKIITEFEMVTAIAMYYYNKQNCDIVVLEVGLGGRFDATNVIENPLVCAITSISYDHTDILGDTLEKIAFEKCGIIKQNSVVVSYPKQELDALAVIMEQAAAKNARLIIGANPKIISCDISGNDIEYDGLKIHIPLIGEHQVYNCITAVCILQQLRQKGYNIADSNIINGIAAVRFPARMEILNKNPLVILDGAHNYSGMTALNNALDRLSGRKINAIVGMLRDKDVSGSMALISKHFQRVFTVTPNNPRAMSAQDLAAIVSVFCKAVVPYDDKKKAYSDALANTGKDDALIICGSLYLASEIRRIILDGIK